MSRHKKIDGQRILMLTGSLGAGGKERQLINLLQHLRSNGIYSIYLAVMNPGGLREQEAAVYSERIYNIYRLFSADIISSLIRICKIINQNEIKLIHSWGSGIWDVTAMLAAKLCGIPFLHGGIRSAPKSLKLSDHLSRWSAKCADVVVANSHAGLKAFRMHNNLKTQVIYNGVDLTRIQKLTHHVNPNRIVMVSNFRTEKDHKTLIFALPEIIKVFPETELYLVGQDYGTLDDIRVLVQQLRLQEQVIINTHCLDPESVISECQIGILSTHGEGFSNVILEYMALSKPVIATDVGGNPELVVHGSTGYLVPEKNPIELAHRVIELLEAPNKGMEMGAEGRKMVLEKYAIEKMGSAYEALYQLLID
jgi:glycosyltransferase involved in cell wall biosynthesis